MDYLPCRRSSYLARGLHGSRTLHDVQKHVPGAPGARVAALGFLPLG